MWKFGQTKLNSNQNPRFFRLNRVLVSITVPRAQTEPESRIKWAANLWFREPLNHFYVPGVSFHELMKQIIAAFKAL